MSKADELAEKNCRLCPNNNNCTFVCMFDEFFKHFISGKGIREYICGDIKVPHALCKNADYDCLECIKDYLKGDVAE